MQDRITVFVYEKLPPNALLPEEMPGDLTAFAPADISVEFHCKSIQCSRPL